MEKSIDKESIYEWSLYQYIVKRKIIESKGSKKAFHEGFTVDYVCDLELKYQERQPNSVNDLSEAYKCSATTYNNYYRAYKRLRDMNIIEENHVQQHLPIATIHQPQHEANLQSQLLLSAQEITKLKQELKEQESLNLKQTQEREILTRQLEAVNKVLQATPKHIPIEIDLEPLTKQLNDMQLELVKLDSLKHIPDCIEELEKRYLKSSKLKQEASQSLSLITQVIESISKVQNNLYNLQQYYINHEYLMPILDDSYKHTEYQLSTLHEVCKHVIK